MELLVIRHAEPVRVTAQESGGAPADPELTATSHHNPGVQVVDQ